MDTNEAFEALPHTQAVRAAVRALASGRLVVVVDDADREDEADLVAAAASVTTEQMAFIIANTSGIVCVPMLSERCEELGLQPMVHDNTELHGTAFTISVDHASTRTGVSADDRTRTVRALSDPLTRPASLRRPGHIFPLRYREGGVLRRAGHTEASIDLLKLAGLPPAAVISELMAVDGSMLREEAVTAFAKQNELPVVRVADIVAYRRSSERLIEPAGVATLPTSYGTFRAIAYRSLIDDTEHLALVMGDVTAAGAGDIDVLVRVHSECLTGDTLGSLRCDCGSQLEAALRLIADEGRGVLIYLRGHEGRGIGLAHKLRAYELQQHGYDTVDANLKLGLPVDSREYGIGSQMLADLGVRRLRLISNNPSKFAGIEGHGLTIVGRVPLPPLVTDENHSYLKTKRDRMGHLLSLAPDGTDHP
jgi:3,4-dihydroxy 2-butanone 4-phosphate synthase/GTP cyclohydrolase II